MAIAIFLIVGYCILIRLSYHVSLFEPMGVVANMSHSLYDIEPRDSLVKPKPLARSSILVETMRVLRAVASWKTKELLNTESSQLTNVIA